MKNGIVDLRNHLFATLEDLRDDEKKFDLERAKAVVSVAQVIVDSAKAENEFLKITGGDGSGFIPDKGQIPASTPQQPRLQLRSGTR